MVNQYKIFRAALALREFTVQQLADATQVPEQTIRSTLTRHQTLFERLGKARSERRGGAWIRYRLRPEGVAWVREHLVDLDPVGAGPAADQAPPAELLVAERLLVEPLPDGEEASRVLRRAERLLLAGARLVSDGPPHQQDRLMALNHLLTLRKLEFSARDDWEGAMAAWPRLQASLDAMSERLSPLEHGAFVELLRRAFSQSVFAGADADGNINVAALAALFSAVAETLECAPQQADAPRGELARMLGAIIDQVSERGSGVAILIGASAIKALAPQLPSRGRYADFLMGKSSCLAVTAPATEWQEGAGRYGRRLEPAVVGSAGTALEKIVDGMVYEFTANVGAWPDEQGAVALSTQGSRAYGIQPALKVTPNSGQMSNEPELTKLMPFDHAPSHGSKWIREQSIVSGLKVAARV